MTLDLILSRALGLPQAIYLKLAVKKPGLENVPVMSELDLTYKVGRS